MTYPTIVSADGIPLDTDDEFHVYYVTTRRGARRWEDTELQRITVKLTGQMVEIPRAWEFETNTDREGWTKANQIGTFGVNDGSMIIESNGNNPFIDSPTLGFNSATYHKVELHMKSGASGTGQVFLSTTSHPDFLLDHAVSFSVSASEDFQSYIVDFSELAGSNERIQMLRLKPIDQDTRIELDYIRLLP